MPKKNEKHEKHEKNTSKTKSHQAAQSLENNTKPNATEYAKPNSVMNKIEGKDCK